MAYIHAVQYYETDKMSITHHSNYIRWMEEARIAFLSEIGWDFAKLEEMGIVSPVLNVTCDYKKSTTFSEKITIHVSVERFMGVKLQLGYMMENEAGDVVCRASSVHAFLDVKGRPVRMKQEYPGLYQTLTELANNAAENQ
jgi:acyl-CoA thioester hydrolase